MASQHLGDGTAGEHQREADRDRAGTEDETQEIPIAVRMVAIVADERVAGAQGGDVDELLLRIMLAFHAPLAAFFSKIIRSDMRLELDAADAEAAARRRKPEPDFKSH